MWFDGGGPKELSTTMVVLKQFWKGGFEAEHSKNSCVIMTISTLKLYLTLIWYIMSHITYQETFVSMYNFTKYVNKCGFMENKILSVTFYDLIHCL